MPRHKNLIEKIQDQIDLVQTEEFLVLDVLRGLVDRNGNPLATPREVSNYMVSHGMAVNTGEVVSRGQSHYTVWRKPPVTHMGEL